MRRCRKTKDKRRLTLFAVCVLWILSGCTDDVNQKPFLYRAAQMNDPGYTIGVGQGTAAMTVVEQNFPRCKIEYHVSLPDGYLAVKYGKIDAFAFDRHALKYVTVQNPDLALMDEKIGDESIVVGAPPGREELIKNVNAFIRQYRADGTYADMYNRWILGKSSKMPVLPEPKNPVMTLKIGTDGRNEPMNFYQDGRLAGFDIEFAGRLALFLNARCDFYSIEYPAIVTAAASGKIDLLIANLNATPEREKMMLFSEPYVDSEISFLVRRDRLAENKSDRITSLSDLAGRKVGIVTGSAYDSVLKTKNPEAVPEYFNNFSDQTEALKAGKIAAYLVDEPMARDIMNHTSGVTILKDLLTSDGYAFAFAKSQTRLQKDVNAALEEMKNDGTINEIDARWFGADEAAKVLPDLKLDGKNGVVRLATNTGMAPFAYLKDGRIVGYDIEIAMRIAAKTGRRLEVIDMEIASILSSLASGKSDMAACGITVTEERAKSVLFSTPNYKGGIAVMIAAGVPQPVAQNIQNLAGLSGKKVGVLTGSTYDGVLKKSNHKAVSEYFNNFSDQTEALRAGKIAGFLVDEPIARDIMNHSSDVTILKDLLTSDGYAFAFPKRQADLQKRMNAILGKMKNDGTMKRLEAKWFGTNEAVKVLPEITPEAKNGVIRLATNGNLAPFAYVKNDRIVGYDIEIAMLAAAQMGRRLEVTDMDFAGIIPSLISGKSDMGAGGIIVTAERAKSVLFSTPHYQGGIVVMVLGASEGVQKTPGHNIWSGFISSFERTFVVEDRYKLVLKGLWVTILISVLSAVFGTILGFVVCLMRRTKRRWANLPAKIFIRAIQGTPIVVLLMILYYIVFGSVDINAIAVAVIGFSINFAAYVSEMMRTGIDAVDKGQHEAALALGFSRIQVFLKITFPQAARYVLPVFKGEFISMLKMTSVVGYIAIQDLTKMSDIIRSRTYEAFFPLIATAIIYFIIAYAMVWLLTRVEMRVDPKQRKRTVTGVTAS